MLAFSISMAAFIVSPLSAGSPLASASAQQLCANNLTVTNMSGGAVRMAWQFDDPKPVYQVMISYADTHVVINSFSSTATVASASNLPTGVNLRFAVSNGAGWIVIEDVVE